MSPAQRSHHLLDRLGATGSLVCAVHCALLPVAIAMLPALGIASWLGDGFELGFVTFATLLGLFSVVWGYRRHGEVRALVPHAITMTLGGSLVGLAHFANLRLVHMHTANCARDASCAR